MVGGSAGKVEMGWGRRGGGGALEAFTHISTVPGVSADSHAATVSVCNTSSLSHKAARCHKQVYRLKLCSFCFVSCDQPIERPR